jgi:hypothetical protein
LTAIDLLDPSGSVVLLMGRYAHAVDPHASGAAAAIARALGEMSDDAYEREVERCEREIAEGVERGECVNRAPRRHDD